MPDFHLYLVIGLALGGVYAMSGVGLVVLYRTTGVLNLFYGAVGSLGSLVAWELANVYGWNRWLTYAAVILMAGLLTLLYGWVLGPPLANRDPLVKASASLGFALILLGFMQWKWTTDVRSIDLPTSARQFKANWFADPDKKPEWFRINLTQGLAMIIPIVLTVITVLFLNRSKLGTAMRALADDRDNTALLGVPVRKVEAAAWFVSGMIFGLCGLLFAELVSMEIVALTFSIPIAALAAALIGRVESLIVTVVAAFVIGLLQSSLNAVSSLAAYRNTTPFVIAIAVLLYFGWRRQVGGRVA